MVFDIILNMGYFSNDCEYVLVYAKVKGNWKPYRLPLSEKQIASYYQNPDNDPRGPWNSATYTCNKSRSERPKLYYPITNPFTGEKVFPKETAVWAYSEEQCAKHVQENMLFWGVDGKAKYPRFKKFISDNKGVVTRNRLLVEKKQAYAEYRQVKKEMQEYLIAKQTVETILNIDKKKEQEKEEKKPLR